MLVELDDQALAVSIAADTRMGWAVERMPVTIEPVEADWGEDDIVAPTQRRIRIDYDSDDESRAPPSGKSKIVPFDMPVVERGSVEHDSFYDEPGTTTFYGCRLCTSLVPAAAESTAWAHVLRSHGSASLPSDEDIWALRVPTPIEAE